MSTTTTPSQPQRRFTRVGDPGWHEAYATAWPKYVKGQHALLDDDEIAAIALVEPAHADECRRLRTKAMEFPPMATKSITVTPPRRFTRVDDPGFYEAHGRAFAKHQKGQYRLLDDVELDAIELLDPPLADEWRRLRAKPVQSAPITTKSTPAAASPRCEGCVSYTALDKVLDALVEGLQEGLKAAFQKHRDARLALEQRVAALEATPSLKFTGTYMDTNTYVPGDCTTRQGGLWICTAATTGPFDHAAWVLAVKKGDAR